MKIRYLMAFLALYSNFISAEIHTEKWMDFNYVPCEGIGPNGTGFMGKKNIYVCTHYTCMYMKLKIAK